MREADSAAAAAIGRQQGKRSLSSAEQIRRWRGPALLSYGYRPFFLFAAILAALQMIAWIFIWAAGFTLPTALDPISWHAHSFLFDYFWAILGGFLLTAVPNWTGRLPIAGYRLAGLAALWLLGRVAVNCSALIPISLAIVLEMAFPCALIFALGREIIIGKNYRNLKVLVIISLMIPANLIFDYQAYYQGYGANGAGARLACALAVMLIILIGGRIIPSFTRNWLVKRGSSRLLAPFGVYDKAVMALSALALLAWVIFPNADYYNAAGAEAAAILLLLAGMANFTRWLRWKWWLTLAEPLVWVLHLAYLFVPLGFIAVALAVFGWLPAGIAPAQHLWLAGAMGLMSMAVMTRASLGHSGRALTVGATVTSLYVAIFASAWLRLIAGLLYNNLPLLLISAALWIYAFAGFAVLYWRILTGPRLPR